jgi:hypothetical protein
MHLISSCSKKILRQNQWFCVGSALDLSASIQGLDMQASLKKVRSACQLSNSTETNLIATCLLGHLWSLNLTLFDWMFLQVDRSQLPAKPVDPRDSLLASLRSENLKSLRSVSFLTILSISSSDYRMETVPVLR